MKDLLSIIFISELFDELMPRASCLLESDT